MTKSWYGHDNWGDYGNPGNHTTTVDDPPMAQPMGFVWFSKPRYIVQAPSRKY